MNADTIKTNLKSAIELIALEIDFCRRHEETANQFGLISAEQAWRFRRGGLERGLFFLNGVWPE